ncbi:DUF2599 domain-containing protein [Pseudomonas quasicaspiana]|uniref:DUF2599 domain-containing protein n=1 Tax=Pseudomonas quasicaspiana TaxID=2829821 RepID=UPI001E4F14CD|nr:DUF2599 domain-containing protein [Pseudomonas quasicaspiana]MCD5972071.1 DUF2599 domain-containing protein [Pseudomonas quasicaspiana]
MNRIISIVLLANMAWAVNASADDSKTLPTCMVYIDHGTWVYRYQEWTLEIVPTPCGRNVGADETAYTFFEIAKKFSGSEHWGNTRGMINQLTCHYAIARNKPEWNLDPWRPYVGHAATVEASCNVTVPKPDTPFE